MDQRHQEPVFVQAGVDRYFMFATVASVVAVACHALIYDLEMDMIGNYKFKSGLDSMLR
jgi:hypothetical protein